jgi:acyl carrier protein
MPTESAEKLILDVFRQVLKNPDITSESEFFEHGGDSLMAIDALAQICEHTGVDLDMAAIFIYPTARELSAALAAGPRA